MIGRRVPGRLLRRHVARRADREPGTSQGVSGSILRRRAHGLGDPEIQHHGVPVLQEDVLRLQVAMHHALAVRVSQRARDFAGDPHGVGDRQLAVACQAMSKRFAPHERHGVVREAVGVACTQHGDEVRMTKARGELDLASEPFDAHRCRKLGR